MAETGWSLMDTMLRSAQSVVGALAGEEPAKPSSEPPLQGPPNLDEAAADFGNRLALLAMMTPFTRDVLSDSWKHILDAAIKSFGGIEPKGLRQWMALPFQLPLSFGNMFSQVGLRGLHAYYTVGLKDVAELALYGLQVFTDAEIYTTLQYNEHLSQLAEQVRLAPSDARMRFLLGDTYIKLGRYIEASQELAEAAKDPAIRPAALQQSSVANYYAGNFSQASRDGAASLALEPSNDKTRFWLWQAAQKLGGYPSEVPEALRMELKVGYHPTKVQFENIATQIGLDKTSGGRGTAVFDLDGDGYLDVVVASNHGGISVYRNNGDGTFRDASVGSGLEHCYDTFAIGVGDYNNDGWDDLYITRLGFYPGESQLFRNNGDGTFTDVSKEAGVGNWGAVFTAVWADYDCDGRLDLFISGNQGKLFEPNLSNHLFHNNGDGTFADVTKQAGISAVSPTIGCSWGDYNNDGYPDLFLSSAIGRAQLYRNNGDGTFTDVSREAGIDEISLGFISLWCDYDNDGWLDLVQFVWSPEDDMLHTLIHGKGPANGHPLRVFHNNRDGTFTLKSEELGFDECWGTMCGNMGDFNNDGYMDMLLGNGAPPMDRTEPPILYEYDGVGKFHNVTFAAGLPFTGKGHGANMADLFGDGRLSLIIADGGMYPGDMLATSVFQPKTLPGNYLNVRLTGTTSNRNAIGARLKLEAGGRSQYRLVSGGSGFGCMPFEQHFGLGDIGQIDSLEIVWPSGLKQRFENLPVNNSIKIVEGDSVWEEIYRAIRNPADASEAEPTSGVFQPDPGGDGNSDGRSSTTETAPVNKNGHRQSRRSVPQSSKNREENREARFPVVSHGSI